MKKIIPVLVLLVLIAPNLTLAVTGQDVVNFLNCASNPATCAVYGLTNVLASLGGRIVALAAYLAKAAFDFTFNVTNSPVVSQGFAVTLTIANLGFIIGIIIIALATIFRNQTYGIKQLLVSLVAMAILVNFGLVISGVIINFTDQMTGYFLSSFPGAGADTSSFVDTIVNSAAPQGLLFDSSSPQGFLSGIWDTLKNINNNSTGINSASSFVAQLTGAVFVVIFTFLLALAIGIVAIMLFLRYFWLTFLLIMLPLAWLAYVFPALKQHWNKWWQHFFKWTFFAPVLMFFLYLANVIAQSGSGGQDYVNNKISNLGGQNGVAAQLSQSIQRPGLLSNITKELVIIGLIFGGLMAANSIGIAMAGAAMNGAKAAGKWAWGGTKRRAARSARKFVPAQESARKTGREWLNSDSYLKRVAGRGLLAYSRAGREKNVAESKEAVGKMSTQKAIESLQTTIDADQKVALLEKIKNDGKLDQIKNIRQHLDESVFKQTGNEKLYGEILNASGLRFVDSGAKREELKKRTAAGGDDGKAAEEELKKMDKGLADAIKTSKPEDLAKFLNPYPPEGQSKALYGLTKEQYESAQIELITSLAKNGSPDKVRKLYVDTLNPDQVKEFQDTGRRANLAASDVNEKLLKYLDNSKISFLDRTSFGLNPGATPSKKEQEEAEQNINAT